MTRVALIAAALLAASSAAAHADDITWDAPEGCPDEDTVRAQIAAQLGREVEPGDVDVELRVAHDGTRWRVEMTASGGVRTLEAASCDELAESAALIVAMTIDEAAAADVAVVDEPDDGERPPAPDLLHRREVDVSDRTPEAPVPWRVRARAFVVGDLGTMPDAALGAGAAAELALGAWGIEVAAARFGSQRANVPGGTGAALMDVTALTTRLCYTADRRRLSSSGCVGAEMEIVGAEGVDFDDPLAHTTTFGGGPHFGVAWAYRLIGPVAARVDVATSLLLVRPVLVEGGTGTVIHDPNVLIWRGLAGLEAVW